MVKKDFWVRLRANTYEIITLYYPTSLNPGFLNDHLLLRLWLMSLLSSESHRGLSFWGLIKIMDWKFGLCTPSVIGCWVHLWPVLNTLNMDILICLIQLRIIADYARWPSNPIIISGGLLGETLENSIDGAKLKHLITVPSGCGEQNMMSMTPTVIATHYLDVTYQWEKIGVERREEAIKNINQGEWGTYRGWWERRLVERNNGFTMQHMCIPGYIQQLVYRKADNSYSAFTNRPASTWWDNRRPPPKDVLHHNLITIQQKIRREEKF